MWSKVYFQPETWILHFGEISPYVMWTFKLLYEEAQVGRIMRFLTKNQHPRASHMKEPSWKHVLHPVKPSMTASLGIYWLQLYERDPEPDPLVNLFLNF